MLNQTEFIAKKEEVRAVLPESGTRFRTRDISSAAPKGLGGPGPKRPVGVGRSYAEPRVQHDAPLSYCAHQDWVEIELDNMREIFDHDRNP